ncbi:DUF1080 domain-containing protein [Pontibacter silvestris]|uniref:DUF1080 domain-containing protein n=1 Tax=Pontibacter silvestris TaxID=2305183 RepID=A0ABW4WYN8_9BACT|nr:DUF1080 domain-containing protein [Pontibacter silvestris]MCC9135166.1 DUF1080 domain-containing protein [Pontibacter silvestris]
MAEQGDPKDTEVWEPQPKVVTPGNGTAPPSDAVVLFDGQDLFMWESAEGGPAQWKVEDGSFTVIKGAGNIKTKEKFGDIQLHIEWRAPEKIEGKGQGRGNSGILFQERYELQILDSYQNKTYANGHAGSIYKQAIPLVNAMKKPGEWNLFDVFYMAPRFSEEGKLEKPATMTVLLNGVLVQNHTEIKGTTEYIVPPNVHPHGKAAIALQDHENPVSFRNIWVRRLA